MLNHVLLEWLGNEVPDQHAMIYLADEAGAESVGRAVMDVLAAYGIEVAERLPIVRGSWFLRLRLFLRAWAGSEEAKALLADLEYAARLRLLQQPISEVDEKKGAAVAALIQALETQQTAVVMIGSIIILKCDGVLAVRDLSSRELAFMARNPGLVRSPQELLVALDELAIHESRGPRRQPLVGHSEGSS
ncbi:hypothetical protein [Sphaerisporangium aureirubrum]|uniref:Uncharacterized protein n=1 Tax=Sphaerisporangium aureirubrum TaxID=1544736 RepID=A0ABW1NUX9_9ACTN